MTEMEKLARRAVACKGWRWMPGMVNISGVRYDDELAEESLDGPDCLPLDCPNLTDPATIGCLLRLVREALDDFNLCALEQDEFGHWTVARGFARYDGAGHCLSEAEALVCALEAAP